jgi:uncharacterized protein YigE (DUF2233 family)
MEINQQKYVVARIDLTNDSLALFQNGQDGKPLKTFQALRDHLKRQGSELVLGMNAGMFKSDFSALGLCISESVETAPLNRNSGPGNFYWKPNGVFYMDASGAHIAKTEDYRTGNIKLATQSGPMLMWSGQIHPAFKASTSRKIRNAVGIQNSNAVVLVLSESKVTFYELAVAFKDLGCEDALFLDGEICGTYAPQIGRSDNTQVGPMLAVRSRGH